MRQDLDTLKQEVEQALAAHGFVVFRGEYRANEGLGEIYWDTESQPQPLEFLQAAAALDVKLLVFHERRMTALMREEATEKLEAAQLPRDEYREMERTIRKLKDFDGFTCSLQLSFDFANNTYLYETRTSWYDEFLKLLDDLDDAFEGGEDGPEDEPGPLGGYFSHN